MEPGKANNLPQGDLRDADCASVEADATAVVRFRIGGLLRFLSHAETLRLLERACVRAGVPVKYSQGFNPHAKFSLPLPRPVGVASDDELLIVRLHAAGGFPLGKGQEAARLVWQERARKALGAELPVEIVIDSVTLECSSTSFGPESVEYVLTMRQTGGIDAGLGLKAKAADLLASERLVLDRTSPKREGPRRVDVRPFLKSIRFEETRAIVECGVSNAGSIRVGEIMELLDVEATDLAAPIRRRNTIWKIT